ncbi:uncharacterized protein K460DRAFT_404267 [Cucurbitaria berberidis CBS 394.84]|uniref:Uncharacterized protein n=1 Tax=Cucurbitaria berberidis CBS 394.84 TaxID=1168544 RepID=A0A9P4GPG9_9PLEO|nr:uncharacterized protein K460DRAFT_404267 [Cucurbitaria berberidis CBS 394.84]KAF1849016.1 hypothetical protein K460DRAFT_404267 [Cucurbitaria berberidis CBS 394.84]
MQQTEKSVEENEDGVVKDSTDEGIKATRSIDTSTHIYTAAQWKYIQKMSDKMFRVCEDIEKDYPIGVETSAFINNKDKSTVGYASRIYALDGSGRECPIHQGNLADTIDLALEDLEASLDRRERSEIEAREKADASNKALSTGHESDSSQ